MRKITLALLAIGMAFIGTKASAQGKYGADSAECIKYLSYYVEYYTTKNYEEALPNSYSQGEHAYPGFHSDAEGNCKG